MKLKNNSILRTICKICRSKQIELRLTKIKGHSGNIFNDLADSMAREGAKENNTLKINNISIKNVNFIPEWKNCKLDAPLRTFVKQLVQLTYKAKWVFIRKKKDKWHQYHLKNQDQKAFKEILKSYYK